MNSSRRPARSWPVKSAPSPSRSTISPGPAAGSYYDNVLQTQAMRQEMGVSLLKKSQDVTKQQGEAMVQMLEQAGQCQSCESGHTLDTYA